MNGEINAIDSRSLSWAPPEWLESNFEGLGAIFIGKWTEKDFQVWQLRGLMVDGTSLFAAL